jgi:hypothetical protein
VGKNVPGSRWQEVLTAAGCRVEVCTDTAVLSVAEIRSVMGTRCDGAFGLLTEPWG